MTFDELRTVVAALSDDALLPVRDIRPALLAIDDVAPTPAVPIARIESEDELIDADEVARMLGVNARWVRNHRSLFAPMRLSRRCLRFSRTAVTKHMQRAKRKEG